MQVISGKAVSKTPPRAALAHSPPPLPLSLQLPVPAPPSHLSVLRPMPSPPPNPSSMSVSVSGSAAGGDALPAAIKPHAPLPHASIAATPGKSRMHLHMSPPPHQQQQQLEQLQMIWQQQHPHAQLQQNVQQQASNLTPTIKKARTPKMVRVFSCETCGKAFNRKSHLSSHERTHSGAKPYACMVCGKCFTQSGSLNRHVRSHNPNATQQPYPCSVCGKRFTSKKGLAGHMRGGHSSEDKGENVVRALAPASLPISLPNQTFVPAAPPPAAVGPTLGRTNLAEGLPPRMPMPSSRRVVSYDCPVCFKPWPSQELLEKHVRMHSTPAPELDFSFFDEKLPWLDELPLPMLPPSPPASPLVEQSRGFHHQQQPLECMLCWQSFAHCNHLNQHLFSTHFKTPPTSPKRRSPPKQ